MFSNIYIHVRYTKAYTSIVMQIYAYNYMALLRKFIYDKYMPVAIHPESECTRSFRAFPFGCVVKQHIQTPAFYMACWSVLQCVAVCCNVLQCVAVCCSVLQRAAASYRALQCVAEASLPPECLHLTMLQCVAVCCRSLPFTRMSPFDCVSECCSVLQCVAVLCSVLQLVAEASRSPKCLHLTVLFCTTYNVYVHISKYIFRE